MRFIVESRTEALAMLEALQGWLLDESCLVQDLPWGVVLEGVSMALEGFDELTEITPPNHDQPKLNPNTTTTGTETPT